MADEWVVRDPHGQGAALLRTLPRLTKFGALFQYRVHQFIWFTDHKRQVSYSQSKLPVCRDPTITIPLSPEAGPGACGFGSTLGADNGRVEDGCKRYKAGMVEMRDTG